MGLSQVHGIFFSFSLISSTQFLRRRSTRLGEGYSYDDIMKKIESNFMKKQNKEIEMQKEASEQITKASYKPRRIKL